jgi:maltose alpha-D-glucosyltransferase/alpha-amylase
VLALLQGYVPNQGDAWTQRLEHLGHVFEQCLLRPAPEMHAEIEEHHAVEVMHMTRLGRRTAELHRALAQRSGDPAFDAEPVSVADLARWREQTAGEAGDTLDLLQRVHTAGGIPAASDAEHAQRLLAAHEDILARVRTLARGATGGLKTRFHGDYHLGQVLVVEDDFLIIDFEGEPDRPPEQRRRKLSPLVDVAGMLRSFNYAAEAALQRATVDREHDRVRLVPFAEDWEQRVREAFLRGYRDAAAGSGLHAEDSAQRDELVELFCWQKACYELRYELAQRPEWVGVPLRGLLALLARGHGV